ncbi:MAG: hypothetical protein JNK29_13750 [Anaerolineales bacterium]|nr:hypothetical protein [Anaerolineales bacterium]
MTTISFLPECLPTAVGSLPHQDPGQACALVQRYLPEIPAWPQLPRRDFRESIYAQYSAGFPGTVLSHDRLYVDRARDLVPELERLYTHYLEADSEAAALDAEYAAGLARFLTLDFPEARAVKGQVIGPVSWGLTLTDQDRRAILYDEALADAMAKHLRLSAAWQERALRRLAPRTILFVDEPSLASIGSAHVAVSREQIVALLEEVFAGLSGLKGVHCCGNTDWGLILETSLNILSFDAYNFGETLALYPQAVRAFLRRGGLVAWGIVPVTDAAEVTAQTAAKLTDDLETLWRGLAAKGVPFDDLAGTALITPACGLGTLPEPAAEQALALTAEVSRRLRQRYFGRSAGDDRPALLAN